MATTTSMVPQPGARVEFVYYCQARNTAFAYPVRWRSCDMPGCTTPCCFTAPMCVRHSEEVYGVRLQPSPTIPMAGLGLVALRPMRSGEWICPLWGEVLTEQELNERYVGEDALAPFAVALDGVLRQRRASALYVDGAAAPFLGGFANTLVDFSGHCDASQVNARLEVRSSVRRCVEQSRAGLTHPTPASGWCLWLRTCRDVSVGEEIFWDYGPDYRLSRQYEYRIHSPPDGHEQQ